MAAHASLRPIRPQVQPAQRLGARSHFPAVSSRVRASLVLRRLALIPDDSAAPRRVLVERRATHGLHAA